MKYGAYINLFDKQNKKTHWILLSISKNGAMSFDFFGIEHISQKELSKIIGKLITHNIFRIQFDDFSV